jgi:hypothetical protein
MKKENGHLYKYAEEVSKEEDERAGRRIHRGAYHRHFEGYSEYYEEDNRGRLKIHRVYTGTYYSIQMPKRKRRLWKLIYVLLWLALAVVYAYSSSLRGGANLTKYGAVCSVGCIVGVAWIFLGLFAYLLAPLKMTVGEWRSSSERMRSGCLWNSVFCFLYAAATIVNLVISGFTVTHIVCIVGFVFCLLLTLTIFAMEKNVPYQKEQSAEAVPAYAARIR